MTNERDAIDATRRFLAASRQAPLNEDAVTVRRESIDGRDAWVVGESETATRGGEEPASPVLYLVDVSTGRLFGYFMTGRLLGKQVRLSRSLFPDEVLVPGQIDRSVTPDPREQEAVERAAAITVVNGYLRRIGHGLIDEATAEVRREIVVEHDSWIVSGLDALNPDEPAWTQQTTGEPVCYFVDAATREVFGYEARSRVFFDPADRDRHEVEVAATASASSSRSGIRRWLAPR